MLQFNTGLHYSVFCSCLGSQDQESSSAKSGVSSVVSSRHLRRKSNSLLHLSASKLKAWPHSILEEEPTKVLLQLLDSLSKLRTSTKLLRVLPCSLILCLPPSRKSSESLRSSTLLPIPLPTLFTHVYTSPEPPDPEGKTSLFDQVSSS